MESPPVTPKAAVSGPSVLLLADAILNEISKEKREEPQTPGLPEE
jgi:hypothetical protein